MTARSPRDLLAVLCSACARDTDQGERLAAAAEYDQALVCPRCHLEHEHPLGRGRRIHAVARCFGDEATGCRLHHAPIRHGLCDRGRSIYEGAYASVAGSANRPREPWEDRLIVALARAKKREDLDAQLRQAEPLMDALGRAIDRFTETLVPPKAPPPRLRRGKP